MAKLSAHGAELYRYFSPQRGALIANHEDGTTLYRSPFSNGWKVLGRKKPEISMAEWRARKEQAYLSIPAWARNITTIPSQRQLDEWSADSLCETPTGHTVEPDGTGPDGVPSWLRILRLI